jgi:FSR family fosmidomycin resistance protein-like MFS transporter
MDNLTFKGAFPMNNLAQTRYLRIGVLSVGHMVNDFYANFLPQLLPFLIALAHNFTATRAAILISVFSITSSMTQPVFGYWMDRQGRRWLVYIGTLWMAVMLSLTGIAQNYLLLVILAALAGFGTAVFHPQAYSMVNLLSVDHKAVMLSIFAAFGNFGFALAPLLLIPLFQAFGLRATLIMAVPGIVMAVLLIFSTPRNVALKGEIIPLSEVINSLKSASLELSSIIGVVTVRALAYTAMLTLFPLYFKEQHISNIAGSHLVTIMLAAGAVGGVIGGFIADRYGRKRLTVWSLLISSPLFFGFFLTHGVLSAVFLALAGAALLSSFSVTILSAQEAIPNNKSLAAGLTLGFAIGLGGFAAILIGKIADTWGLNVSVIIIFLLPLVAGLFGLLMKDQPAARAQILSPR